jgi:hypothetical protein
VITVVLTYSPGAGPAPAAAIRVEFAGPARQDRPTVLTRLVLAVPHFIGLGIARIATQIVIVGGWFVALAKGVLRGQRLSTSRAITSGRPGCMRTCCC